jgi:hypothetical protein
MRWFTREWQSGQLTDEEAEARDPAYARYIKSVADRMPPHIFDFAMPTNAHISVDDAKVDRAEIDIAGRSIRLRLLNGDLQEGYGKLNLDFIDAELIEPTVERLRVFLANPRTEFLRQEVEPGEGVGTPFEVGFLLWPDGQITIRCTDLVISWVAVEDRTRKDYRSDVIVTD